MSEEILRRARSLSGLSQRALAALSQVPQPAIARYESGAVKPSFEQLRRLVAAAGLDLRVEVVPAPAPAGRTHRLHELRSLAYHRLVAERLINDPALLERARRRAAGWLDGTVPFAGSREYAAAWARLLDRKAALIATAIRADTAEMRALRQSSPFAGLLGPAAWTAIVREIREEPAAGVTGHQPAVS